MESLIVLALFIVVLVIVFFAVNLQKVVIYEYEMGLLYKDGKITRSLHPGAYWLFKFNSYVQRVDMRLLTSIIPGQEVLTADNLSIRVSLVVNYKIREPQKLVTQVESYQNWLYQQIQLQFRELVMTTTLEDLLSQHGKLNEMLLEGCKPKIEEAGYDLVSVAIKDIMLPGELKTVYAQVARAKQEGLAALERARGETAALRHLANAAKTMENNPALMQLRLLQAVGQGTGNSIVLKMDGTEESK